MRRLILIQLLEWIKRLVVLACFIQFMVQMSRNIDVWLQEPVVSTYNIKDDSPLPLPAVTICPSPALDVRKLIEMGLNISDYDPQQLTLYLHRHTGVEGDPENIWKNASWHVGALIKRLDVFGESHIYSDNPSLLTEWKVSHTPLGPCFTYMPKYVLDSSEGITVHMSFPIPQCQIKFDDNVNPVKFGVGTSCEDIEFYCNSSCAWEKFVYMMTIYIEYAALNVILHPVDEPPTLMIQEAVIPMNINALKDYVLEVLVDPREVTRVSRSSHPCIRKPGYSEAACRQRCTERCHPRSLLERPSHPTWSQKNIQNTCVVTPNSYTFEYQKVSRKQYDCQKRCLPRCSEILYYYKTLVYPTLKTNDLNIYTLRIRPKSHIMITVTEAEAYTTPKLLADTGGNLGLFLGISLLSFWSAFVNMVIVICKHFKSTPKSKDEKKESVNVVPKDSLIRNKHLTKHTKMSSNGRNKMSITSILKYMKKILITKGEEDESHSGSVSEDGKRDETHVSHVRKLLYTTGFTVLVCITVVHCLLSIISYITQPVSTVLTLANDPVSFPQVTLCQDMPFKPSVLMNFGLNTSEIPCKTQDTYNCRSSVIKSLLDKLPGIWQDDTNLTSLWTKAEKELEDIIYYSALDRSVHGNWNSILTTNNLCYQLLISNYSKDITLLQLYFNMDDLQEEFGMYNEYLYSLTEKKAFLIIPQKDHKPLAIFRSQSLMFTLLLDFSLQPIISVLPLAINRLTPCEAPPYSRAHCIELCQLREMAERVGCSMPYIANSTLPACNTIQQYEKSPKYITSTKLLSEFGSSCAKKCNRQCSSTYYYVDNIQILQFFDSLYPRIDIELSTDTYYNIQEVVSKSFARFLSEIGGIVGLYLGWSLLDTGIWIGELFLLWCAPLRKRITLKYQRLMQFTFLMTCVLSACLFCIYFVAQYALNEDFYTTLETQKVRPDQLPSVTVCRWPPFNVSKLVELGLLFNISAYCRNYWGRFYRCQDDGDAYTFSFTLNTDYAGERKVKGNDTSELLLNALRTYNLPYTQVIIHSRNEIPSVIKKSEFMTAVEYTRVREYRISLSVEEESLLSRKGGECVRSTDYVQAACFAKCEASHYSREFNCRLPFISWLPELPFCSQKNYSLFPREMGKKNVKLFVSSMEETFDPVTATCNKECPKACRRTKYTLEKTSTDASISEVKIRFKRSIYDHLKEEDAYVLTQLINDIGGVAGFMLGASLLSIFVALADLLKGTMTLPDPKNKK
ncbi:hypothetical protein SK128_006387 [Halocaridina rubra]|uniref:Uncharacterized protein n=1 Tax=Halocaridina rubra TaxID=373956 RepID=A0AAN8ZWS6_HALRR